jgi:GT2 family glycosyltransferase
VPEDQFEVLVVIDGSEDGTREMVDSFAAPFALRGLWQSNRGRAAACNTGIRAARGELIVLLDDDMEPTPGFLAAHMRAHQVSNDRGVVGAVPVEINAASSPIQRFIGSKFNQHLIKLEQHGRIVALRDFYSGNFSISRDVLDQVGGFDEIFTAYGNEDLELSLRLTAVGIKLMYDPLALAYQRYTKDFLAVARDNMDKGRTSILLATKHPESMGNLKLDTYRHGSLKWRFLRSALLIASRGYKSTPNLVILVIHWLEARKVARLDLFYNLALDYFFWLGVIETLKENRHSGHGLVSLPAARKAVSL